jgi:hypothetical protein
VEWKWRAAHDAVGERASVPRMHVAHQDFLEHPAADDAIPVSRWERFERADVMVLSVVVPEVVVEERSRGDHLDRLLGLR